MVAKDRELRKTLLLVKGDALRLQLGLEMGLLRNRLAPSRALSHLLPRMAAGMLGGRPRRPWSIFRLVLEGVNVGRALYRLFQ